MGSALFIPEAESLLTVLQLESGAAGFLPERWIPAGIPTVTIEGLSTSALDLPILAVLENEPTGPFKDFILCVQATL
jgi:hypothetical protein